MLIKVAIAEDNHRFRKAFLRLMASENELEFIISAENGVDLLSQLEFSTPEIILMDIRMPVSDGFEATKIIHKKYPLIKIVAFTMFDLIENIIEMSRIGVKSFIGKDQLEDIPRILKIIYAGGVYYPDHVAEKIRLYLNSNSTWPARDIPKISEIELTILQGICKGLSCRTIGDLISKSPRTVEKYRNDLYLKFNVANQKLLIAEAVRHHFF